MHWYMSQIQKRTMKMSRIIKLSNNWYEENEHLYRRLSIHLIPGVTTLVGCNGSGKTTMIHQIKSQLKKEGVPYITYDNLTAGGHRSVSEAMYFGNISLGATMMTSSEGENIMTNVGMLAGKLHNFIKTGQTKERNPFEVIFTDKEKEKVISNERWILLDAVDSGLSIDNMEELQSLFQLILKDARKMGIEVYIILSTNSYEFAKENPCFDVRNGKYIQFENYKEYRNFILQSRKVKDKRYQVVNEEHREKEIEERE